MSIRPWLRFFRVPNLPTALGDAAACALLLLHLLEQPGWGTLSPAELAEIR